MFTLPPNVQIISIDDWKTPGGTVREQNNKGHNGLLPSFVIFLILTLLQYLQKQSLLMKILILEQDQSTNRPLSCLEIESSFAIKITPYCNTTKSRSTLRERHIWKPGSVQLSVKCMYVTNWSIKDWICFPKCNHCHYLYGYDRTIFSRIAMYVYKAQFDIAAVYWYNNCYNQIYTNKYRNKYSAGGPFCVIITWRVSQKYNLHTSRLVKAMYRTH